jgi:hypothetical protein
MAAFDRLEARHPDDIGLRELIEQLCCIQSLA